MVEILINSEVNNMVWILYICLKKKNMENIVISNVIKACKSTFNSTYPNLEFVIILWASLKVSVI